MKTQALFYSEDKSKKLKCRLLLFLFGSLRVKIALNLLELTDWSKSVSADNLDTVRTTRPEKCDIFSQRYQPITKKFQKHC